MSKYGGIVTYKNKYEETARHTNDILE